VSLPFAGEADADGRLAPLGSTHDLDIVSAC